jgi:photosystem II stability/assembly factor-like uncharacterized protein
MRSKQHSDVGMPGCRRWPVGLIYSLAAVSLIAVSARPLIADQLQPWDDLYSVASLPSGIWYAVGVAGTLLTSNDDGRTWTHRKIAGVQPFGWLDLHSVRFPDRKHGWICGEKGLVLRTDDGGETWRRQSTGISDELYRLAPADANDAIAVGANGIILYTRDGGEHWNQKRQRGELDYFDATMSDASNGWVVGEFETILHTPDGGETWEIQRGGKRTNFRAAALFSVSFRDAQDGLVTGQSGTFLATSDGKTWRSLMLPTAIPMYAAEFTDRRIWMAGDNGTLLDMAIDGVEDVSKAQPTAATLTDVGFRGSTGIAVGFNGTVLRTDDNGLHWHKVGQK